MLAVGKDGKYHNYNVSAGRVTSFTDHGVSLYSAPYSVRAEAERLQREEDERQRKQQQQRFGR